MQIPKEVIEQLEHDLAHAASYEDLMGKNGAIKKLMKHSLEQLLNAELTQQLGYEKHTKTSKKDGNARNGSSAKTIQSDLGSIDLEIPRDRLGEFSPVVVKKHQRHLGSVQDSIISMYAKGMSVRDIQTHVEDIYGLELSPSAISSITETVMTMVREWQDRPLEPLYPIVFLDAIYYKVRQEGKILTKAAYTCLAINLQGQKELLGLWMNETEGATFWLSVLTELRNRGVEDILIACVDGLKGFPEAITTIFPYTAVQQCIIHQIRQTLRYISWKHHKKFLTDLKQVYGAPSEESARAALEHLEQTWGTLYPLPIKSWRTHWGYLATYFQYPPDIRKMIYTTNAVEALHRQFRKVTKAKTIFPNDDALFKMLFLAYRDIAEKWTMAIHNWPLVLSQLTIIFEQRVVTFL